MSQLGRIYRCLALVAAFVLLSHVVNARAALFTQIQLCAPPNGCFLNDEGPTGGPRTANTSGSGTDFTFSASAFAFADNGILKISGTSSVTTDGINSQALTQTQAFAQSLDTMTISNVNLVGQTGFIHATVLVEAGASATGSGNAQVIWDFDLNNVLDLRQGIGSNCPACNVEFAIVNGVSVGDPTDLFSISIPFIFGSAFDINMVANGSTFTGGAFGTDAFATFDLSQSIYWGGIDSVTTTDGTVVPFSLVSASGFDWTQSRIPTQVDVPEPASLLLLGLGLAGLGFSRYKSKKS